jgi:hypothetical protein
MDDFDETTRGIPRETIAELMAKIGGHAQAPAVKRENFYTELATTQVLPVVEQDQPNQE